MPSHVPEYDKVKSEQLSAVGTNIVILSTLKNLVFGFLKKFLLKSDLTPLTRLYEINIHGASE